MINGDLSIFLDKLNCGEELLFVFEKNREYALSTRFLISEKRDLGKCSGQGKISA